MPKIDKYVKNRQARRVIIFLTRLFNRVEQDNLSLVAAGVAFYTFLSIFPALASAISIYGLFADAHHIEQQFRSMEGVIPPDALNIFIERATKFTEQSENTLTFGLFFGLLVSFWSANRAMKALTTALNIAYDHPENRGFIKVNIITLSLTLASTLVFIFALTAIVLVPIIVTTLITSTGVELFVVLISWCMFIGSLFGLFLMLYNFAPAIHHISLKSLFPGAITASLLTVLTSFCFTIYVANFGKYDEQYGALGAVVITLLWIFLCALIFLLGAEINAEIELRYGKSKRNTARSGSKDDFIMLPNKFQ